MAGDGNNHAVSVRVEFRAGQRVGGQRRHDMRLGRVPGYVDAQRSADNSIIIAPASEAQLRRECERRRAQHPHQRAMKRNAATAAVGIITFGTRAQATIEALAHHEQDAYYLSAAQAIANRMGTTLSGLVVHRDESAPHAHFQMPAYNRDGVSISHERERGLYASLQDTVAAVFADLGLQRGYSKADRRARGARESELVHRSVRQLHEDLPQEIAAARERLEHTRQLADQARGALAAAQGDTARLEMQMKRYEQRVHQARERLKHAEAVLDPTMPSAMRVERVMRRSPRLFGLLQDRLETSPLTVVSARASRKALLGLGDRVLQAEQHAARQAERARRAEQDASAQRKVRESLERDVERLGVYEYQRGGPRPGDHWPEHMRVAAQRGFDGARRRDEAKRLAMSDPQAPPLAKPAHPRDTQS